MPSAIAVRAWRAHARRLAPGDLCFIQDRKVFRRELVRVVARYGHDEANDIEDGYTVEPARAYWDEVLNRFCDRAPREDLQREIWVVSRDDLAPLDEALVNELHARLLGRGPGPRH
jgi:hypothetical protein